MHKWFPSQMTRLSKREYRAALGAALLAVALVFGAFSFAPSAHAASLIPASSSGVQQAGLVSQSTASYPKKGWVFDGRPRTLLATEGTIIFYNRSVHIDGKVLPGNNDCAAAVFLVYSGAKRLSSATRPGTGQYYCTSDHTFGFTLPANVAGGASKVVVQLWIKSCKCMVAHRDVKR